MKYYALVLIFFICGCSLVRVDKGAVTVNLDVRRKPPPIEAVEVKGIRPITLDDLQKSVSDPKLIEDIVNNMDIYKSVIEALSKRIDTYNQTYSSQGDEKKNK
ncbi:MAG: hypothetical protein ACXWMH_08210 [Syntrophales bacterium]